MAMLDGRTVTSAEYLAHYERGSAWRWAGELAGRWGCGPRKFGKLRRRLYQRMMDRGEAKRHGPWVPWALVVVDGGDDE